jgi:hypothetical protein
LAFGVKLQYMFKTTSFALFLALNMTSAVYAETTYETEVTKQTEGICEQGAEVNVYIEHMR